MTDANKIRMLVDWVKFQDWKIQEIEELQAKVERLEEALAALGRNETTT